MNTIYAATMSLLLAAPVLLGQTNPPDKSFSENNGFKCEFDDGDGRDLFVGKVANRRGLKFPPVVVDNVNYRTRSARLLGDTGQGTLDILSDLEILTNGQLAVTFLQRTVSDGIITITVFDKTPTATLTYPAVMSRHGVFTGSTVMIRMMQDDGTCRGLP